MKKWYIWSYYNSDLVIHPFPFFKCSITPLYDFKILGGNNRKEMRVDGEETNNLENKIEGKKRKTRIGFAFY